MHLTSIKAIDVHEIINKYDLHFPEEPAECFMLDLALIFILLNYLLWLIISVYHIIK